MLQAALRAAGGGSSADAVLLVQPPATTAVEPYLLPHTTYSVNASVLLAGACTTGTLSPQGAFIWALASLLPALPASSISVTGVSGCAQGSLNVSFTAGGFTSMGAAQSACAAIGFLQSLLGGAQLLHALQISGLQPAPTAASLSSLATVDVQPPLIQPNSSILVSATLLVQSPGLDAVSFSGATLQVTATAIATLLGIGAAEVNLVVGSAASADAVSVSLSVAAPTPAAAGVISAAIAGWALLTGQDALLGAINAAAAALFVPPFTAAALLSGPASQATFFSPPPPPPPAPMPPAPPAPPFLGVTASAYVTLQLYGLDAFAVAMKTLPLQWAAQFAVNASQMFITITSVNASVNLTLYRQSGGVVTVSATQLANLRKALAAALPASLSGVSQASGLFGNVSQFTAAASRRLLQAQAPCAIGQTCLALPLTLAGLGTDVTSVAAAVGALLLRRNQAILATAADAQASYVSQPVLAVRLAIIYACAALNQSACFDPCAGLPSCSSTSVAVLAPLPSEPQADALRKSRLSASSTIAVVVLAVAFGLCCCVCLCISAHRFYRQRAAHADMGMGPPVIAKENTPNGFLSFSSRSQSVPVSRADALLLLQTGETAEHTDLR
jgi:hypothetical protein